MQKLNVLGDELEWSNGKHESLVELEIEQVRRVEVVLALSLS